MWPYYMFGYYMVVDGSANDVQLMFTIASPG